MIMKVLLLLSAGAKQIFFQPRILFVVVLVVAFPVLLTAMLQQFLAVANDNYTTAARQRIGTLHDTSSALLRSSASTTLTLNVFIADVLGNNPDIEDMVVAKTTSEGIVLIASNSPDSVGGVVEDEAPYTRALAASGAPLAFEFYVSGIRYWDTTSSFVFNNERWFVVTRQSFEGFDTLVESREMVAYGILLLAFVFLFGLGYWLIRDIDYQTKYLFMKQRLDEQAQISNMIAHELRAPLTAMRGYASMISEKSQPGEKTYEHAMRITDATDRLVRLVSDFLEVARLQSGQLKIKIEPVLVADIITRTGEELRSLAEEKNLELQIAISGYENLTITSDGARLQQILTNITSNAIKYTPSGRVTIELHDSRKTIEIRVKDTGTGISAEDQKRLFAPFFRVQSTYTESVTGTGLGMWITKQLVERLQGTIGIESIKDVGTNVVVTLPKETEDTSQT